MPGCNQLRRCATGRCALGRDSPAAVVPPRCGDPGHSSCGVRLRCQLQRSRPWRTAYCSDDASGQCLQPASETPF
eukprot:9112503-Alexandrium_andersonii.AAC.1